MRLGPAVATPSTRLSAATTSASPLDAPPASRPPAPRAIVTYCTNSHAGETLAEVQRALTDVFSAVRQRLVGDAPMAVGLWLPAKTVRELLAGDALPRFRDFLRRHGFFVPSLNAFPYGGFHDTVVKERVYEPAWWDAARVDYTLDCAKVLSALLADSPKDFPTIPGAISTVGGGNAKLLKPDAQAAMHANLGRLAREFSKLFDATGHEIVLGLEPEPLTALEDTPSVLRFFDALIGDDTARNLAGSALTLQRYIGVCFDACHQAVLWENVPEAYRAIQRAGIRMAKTQISCAVECPPSAEARLAMRRYSEPRYLHQVYAVDDHGALDGKRDLNEALGDPAWQADATWRCHFHVPIYLNDLGHGLKTTRAELTQLLAAIRAEAAVSGNVPLLEVETYTWSVLPPELEPERDPKRPGGPAGLTAEMAFVRDLWNFK